MAEAAILNIKKREKQSKGYLKQKKREDWIPGVVYGKGKNPLPVFMGKKDLYQVFRKHGSRGIIRLQMEEETEEIPTLIREVQQDAIDGHVVHIDFMVVNRKETITSKIPVIIEGEAEVVKRGGILQVGAQEIEVRCLPQDLPEALVCDIASLKIGDVVNLRDLTIPEGVECIDVPETMILSILAPGKEEADEEEEEASDETAVAE